LSGDRALNFGRLGDGGLEPIMGEDGEVEAVYYTVAELRGNIGRWKGRRLEPLVEKYYHVIEKDCSVAVKVG